LSSFALAEVAAALARGTGDSDLALMAVAELRRLSGLTIIPIDEHLGELASRVAALYSVRGCDAVYISLALALEITLVTLDRQQLERAPSNVAALSPVELLQLLS